MKDNKYYKADSNCYYCRVNNDNTYYHVRIEEEETYLTIRYNLVESNKILDSFLAERQSEEIMKDEFVDKVDNSIKKLLRFI